MFTNEPNFKEMIECQFALCPEEPYSKIGRRELQCYSLLVKPTLSLPKHEYVKKEVEHGVKMISQEVQFCFFFVSHMNTR